MRQMRWAFVAGAVVGVLAGCISQVDPDRGLFSCATEADCGPGWICAPQASGGGRCFKQGVCVVEMCNGTDDNCDGVVDETFDMNGATCHTGRPGICDLGRFACDAGAVECVALSSSVAEMCNGNDDDCDGMVDEGFDLMTDALHCGACGQACVTGTRCMAGGCVESRCDDGLDNDDAGGIDCLDVNCRGLACGPMGGGFLCRGPDAGPADAGASDGGDSGTPDAGDAGTPDAAVDAGADAGPDAGLDAGSDAGSDAGVLDAGPLPPGCFAP